MMKKAVYCLLVALCCYATSDAQTMVLSVDRSRDTIVSDMGPNKKTFIQFFLHGGFAAGAEDKGAGVMYGNAGEYGGGIRIKYRIGNVYSAGWEFYMRKQLFRLRQNDSKSLPDSVKHDVERFDIGRIGFSVFNRFNFDAKRGNYLGTYLDIGIGGDWLSSFTHLTKDTLPDGSLLKAKQTLLPYANDFAGDVFMRLGRNRMCIYASYRFSDFFTPSSRHPELPRIMAGIDLGIFR